MLLVFGRKDCRAVGVTKSRRVGIRIIYWCLQVKKFLLMILRLVNAGWSSQEARQPHKLKVTGSNPVPTTIFPASAKRPGVSSINFF